MASLGAALTIPSNSYEPVNASSFDAANRVRRFLDDKKFSDPVSFLIMVTLKTKSLLVIVIVGLASALFFYRMYRRDITALEAFVAAYEKFDQAPREDALRELDANANVKISSLIKHDRELMNTMHEIADTAAQEFNSPNNRGLTIKRRSAYSRFRSFAEN